MGGWVTYRGLQVPGVPLRRAGTILKDGLIALAGRGLHDSDPTVNDDSSAGFQGGDEWINTSTKTLWMCLDPADGAANWRAVYARAASATVLSPSAGVGGATDSRAIQFDTGGNARGANAVDFQRVRSSNSQVASGNYSIVLGRNCTASGLYSSAIGRGPSATGNHCSASGYYSTASGVYSTARGANCQAAGLGAYALGANCTASNFGAFAIGGNAAADKWCQIAVGCSNTGVQQSLLQWYGQTTDGTQAEIYLGGVTLHRATISANRVWAGQLDFQAVKTDQSKGVFGRKFFVIRRDGSNNTSLVGSIQTVVADILLGSNSYAISIDADDTNESLRIQVTGDSSETVNWKCTAFFSEVATA